MLARFRVANDVQVLSLNIAERRIIETGIGVVPPTRLKISFDIGIFEDTPVLAKDNSAHEFQIVNREAPDLGQRNRASRQVETLPDFYCSVLFLSFDQR